MKNVISFSITEPTISGLRKWEWAPPFHPHLHLVRVVQVKHRRKRDYGRVTDDKEVTHTGGDTTNYHDWQFCLICLAQRRKQCTAFSGATLLLVIPCRRLNKIRRFSPAEKKRLTVLILMVMSLLLLRRRVKYSFIGKDGLLSFTKN
jgi:hypothetical protein